MPQIERVVRQGKPGQDISGTRQRHGLRTVVSKIAGLGTSADLRLGRRRRPWSSRRRARRRKTTTTTTTATTGAHAGIGLASEYRCGQASHPVGRFDETRSQSVLQGSRDDGHSLLLVRRSTPTIRIRQAIRARELCVQGCPGIHVVRPKTIDRPAECVRVSPLAVLHAESASRSLVVAASLLSSTLHGRPASIFFPLAAEATQCRYAGMK